MTVLHLTSWRIEDATTEEVFHTGILSEAYAETLLKKVRKKNPSAFIRKVEG